MFRWNISADQDLWPDDSRVGRLEGDRKLLEKLCSIYVLNLKLEEYD